MGLTRAGTGGSAALAWANGQGTARRRLRPRTPRPADLGHRPLQLPLHLLHAGRGHAVAPAGPGAHASRRSSASPGCASSASASTASGSPAANRPCGPTCPSWSASWRRCGADLALTTNGATLRTMAGDLVAAGLRRVNISLDTLRRDRFVDLTRRDELGNVLDGIEAAMEAGLDPVKVNAVVMRGVNDDEVVDLADVRPRPGSRRAVHRVDAARRRPAVGVRRRGQPGRDPAHHRRRLPRRSRSQRGHEPAERFAYRDGTGEVGVIPSVTRPFCGVVRPDPAHRRRAAAIVPVRGGRGRPARPAAGRRFRRRSRAPPSSAAWPPSGPGT